MQPPTIVLLAGATAAICAAVIVYRRRSKAECPQQCCASGSHAAPPSPQQPPPAAAPPSPQQKPPPASAVPGRSPQKASTNSAPPLGAIVSLAKETGATRKQAKAALMEHGNDYDEAKASLLPPEPEPTELPLAAPSEHAAIPDVFEPCVGFKGGRPGWVFKRGPLGNGYYRDGVDDPAGIAHRVQGGGVAYVQRC